MIKEQKIISLSCILSDRSGIGHAGFFINLSGSLLLITSSPQTLQKIAILISGTKRSSSIGQQR
jgi:hypothetical protein